MKYKCSIQTRKNIKQAYAYLIKEKKDINKITIKEIVEKANISKSTFYSHYEDIYAVSIDFEYELIEALNKLMNEFESKNKVGFKEYLHKLINLLKENEKLYKNILSSTYPANFIERLKDILRNSLLNDSKAIYLSKDSKVKLSQSSFIANGLIYTLVDYFKGHITQSLDEIEASILMMLR